jgi:hypothetical protein
VIEKSTPKTSGEDNAEIAPENLEEQWALPDLHQFVDRLRSLRI